MNLRLEGVFTLRSPLSHIGESIGTTSYLLQEPIVQPDGTWAEVFVYTGNAWRGQLRDLSAVYMLERLGGIRLPLDSFHLLFSGGRIGGPQTLDLEQVRVWRRAIPHVALFGGGVGNQILPGKLRVSDCYPLCREALPVLPAAWHDEAIPVSYRQLTFERSYSRKDDGKDDGLREYLAEGQARLETEPADQMRYTVELLASGTRLYSRVEVLEATEVEVGCLVAALHQYSRSPHIGGGAGRGLGRADLQYEYVDLDSGESGAFLSVRAGDAPLLAPVAEEAKAAYDRVLRAQYDALLAGRGGEIRRLLGSGDDRE